MRWPLYPHRLELKPARLSKEDQYTARTQLYEQVTGRSVVVGVMALGREDHDGL